MSMDILKAFKVSWKGYILPCSMTSTNRSLYNKHTVTSPPILYHHKLSVDSDFFIHTVGAPILNFRMRCGNPDIFKKKCCKNSISYKIFRWNCNSQYYNQTFNYGQLQGQTVKVGAHLTESSNQTSPLLQYKIFILEQTLQPHSFTIPFRTGIS
jgi:hypothetical protein